MVEALVVDLDCMLIRDPGGGNIQILGECTVSGDVGKTPFYDISDVIKKLQEYVEKLNTNIEKIDVRGPVSKYVLPDENLRGSIEITFEDAYPEATEQVVGHVKPYSITESLPLIRDLQDEGFDIQTSGYVPAPKETMEVNVQGESFLVVRELMDFDMGVGPHGPGFQNEILTMFPNGA